MLVTNRHHPQIRFCRRLLTRKGRQASGMFIAEGIRQVIALLASPHQVKSVIVAPDLLRSPAAWAAIDRYRASGGQLLQVTPDVFGAISIRDNPQGIAAVARIREAPLEDVANPPGDLWVGLLEVQDPGNLGTIVRTCDAVGASGVILLGDGVDPWHPTALRASAGAIFTSLIVRATFRDLCVWTRRHGFDLVGTSDAAEADFREYSPGNGTVVLMGSERYGIPDGLTSDVDRMVRIPMVGVCDSLNLAVATSLILYEFTRHRFPS